MAEQDNEKQQEQNAADTSQAFLSALPSTQLPGFGALEASSGLDDKQTPGGSDKGKQLGDLQKVADLAEEAGPLLAL